MRGVSVNLRFKGSGFQGLGSRSWFCKGFQKVLVGYLVGFCQSSGKFNMRGL